MRIFTMSAEGVRKSGLIYFGKKLTTSVGLYNFWETFGLVRVELCQVDRAGVLIVVHAGTQGTGCPEEAVFLGVVT